MKSTPWLKARYSFKSFGLGQILQEHPFTEIKLPFPKHLAPNFIVPLSEKSIILPAAQD